MLFSSVIEHSDASFSTVNVPHTLNMVEVGRLACQPRTPAHGSAGNGFVAPHVRFGIIMRFSNVTCPTRAVSQVMPTVRTESVNTFVSIISLIQCRVSTLEAKKQDQTSTHLPRYLGVGCKQLGWYFEPFLLLTKILH